MVTSRYSARYAVLHEEDYDCRQALVRTWQMLTRLSGVFVPMALCDLLRDGKGGGGQFGLAVF